MRKLSYRPRLTFRFSLAILATLGAAGLDRDGVAQSTERAKGDDWRIDQVRWRYSLFDQQGRGYQSQAGTANGAGNEAMLLLQPMGLVGIRQNSKVYHQVVVPIDIVSAASVDAIDTTTSASRVNEAGSLDITTTYSPRSDTQVSGRYGFHIEEPVRSVFGGVGFVRSFAQNNTTLGANANAFFDVISDYTYDGYKNGFNTRTTMNANLTLTQVLSPTTLFYGSYGLTYQFGTLQTQWNSVPVARADAPRTSELFPHTRLRHAWSAQLAQHIPQTRTTAKMSYRFYTDTIGIHAHSAEWQVYQYLTTATYVRASYRLHYQSGAEFFSTLLPASYAPRSYRTADSDLATFTAHEVGVKLLYSLLDVSSLRADDHYVDVGYFRYMRSNHLIENVFSLGYGRSF